MEAIFTGKEFISSVDSTTGCTGIILSTSPFYAEQGGQIYDTGVLEGSGTFRVDTVQKFGGYIVHVGEVTAGTLSVGGEALAKVQIWKCSVLGFRVLFLGFRFRGIIGIQGFFWDLKWIFILFSPDKLFQVDYARRSLIAPNHTCTHLLNFALKVHLCTF